MVATVCILSGPASAAPGASSLRPAAPAPAAAPAAAQTSTAPSLPAGNARFIDAAVRDLLGRPSTQADLDRWLDGLDEGQPRGELAGQIARTPEWASVVVTDLYDQVFGRAPDTGGLTYWSGELAAGRPTVELAGLLYESAEFYAASGSTTGGYVDRLYDRILHRTPDAGGRAYWINQITTGTPRATLARLIFRSVESNGQRIDILYERLLRRTSDPDGRGYWAQVLTTVDDLVLAGLLVGSDEYYAAAQARQTTAIATGWLRLGAVGEPYTMRLAATGGSPGYTWAATNLPRGLTIDGATIAGTPTSAGTTSVTLTARDRSGDVATRTVALTIGAAGSDTSFDRITDGNGNSGLAELSTDGRHVVFGSFASDLVPGDDNGEVDVFTFDQATGELIKLTSGTPASYYQSLEPWSISGDGRFIAYESSQPMVAEDDNDERDIFLWDRVTGTTVRINDGTEPSFAPKISAAGDHVVFDSDPGQAGPGAPLSDSVPTRQLARPPTGPLTAPDVDIEVEPISERALAAAPVDFGVHLWTRAGGTTARVSGDLGGGYGNISGDARWVTFAGSDGLVLVDLATGTGTTVDTGSSIRQSDLSTDGRFVVYAKDTVLFRWDRTTGELRTIGTTHPVSGPGISGDGTTVVFEQAQWVGNVHLTDVFRWEAATGATTMVTRSSGRSGYPSISDDGSTIAFMSNAADLVPNGTNRASNTFLWHRPAGD